MFISQLYLSSFLPVPWPLKKILYKLQFHKTCISILVRKKREREGVGRKGWRHKLKREIEGKKKNPRNIRTWWYYHVSFDGINQFEYASALSRSLLFPSTHIYFFLLSFLWNCFSLKWKAGNSSWEFILPVRAWIFVDIK